jgi:hypothetical protein
MKGSFVLATALLSEWSQVRILPGSPARLDRRLGERQREVTLSL